MFEAIRNLLRFREDPLLFTEDVEKSFGRFACLPFGHKNFHFINDADYAEHILLKHVDIYKKSRLIFDQIVPITGTRGIVQLENEAWSRTRAQTAEMFTKQAFLDYPLIIERYLTECSHALDTAAIKKEPIDFAELFVTYTIRCAVKIFLGCRDDDIAQEIARDFIDLNHRCGTRMRNLVNLPLFIKTANNQAITEVSTRLRLRIRLLIEEAWERPEEKNLISNLMKMIEHKDDDAIVFITDQLLTFLFAGFETTSSSLTFCFHLLAKHPDVQRQVREEIATVGHNKILSLDEIRGYAYVQAVYKEALRLYPPAWIVARQAISDDSVDNYLIKKHDTVIVCIRQIHRNHKLWHDAEKFLPERFLSSASRPKCAFMPFGVGPRTCSGAQLAMLEGVNAVVSLTKHFKFSVDDAGEEMPLKALVTLNPKKPVLIKADRL